MKRRAPLLTLVVGMIAVQCGRAGIAAEPLISVDRETGKLHYRADDRGNRVPEFVHESHFRWSHSADVPSVIRVSPVAGDNAPRIQAAIRYAASRPPRADGFRGAVLLAPGKFDLASPIQLNADGVVLRGSGAGEGGTLLRATGWERDAVVEIHGAHGPRAAANATAIEIVDDYVPVGATELTLAPGHRLAVAKNQAGPVVLVTRPSSQAWIDQLGASAFGVGWRPGSRDLHWLRRIVSVEGNRVTLDAPITTAIEKTQGSGTVQEFSEAGMLHNVGIEDLAIAADVTGKLPSDEDHAWYGVHADGAADVWVCRVAFRHLAGGAVHLGADAVRTAVVDCTSEEPISENAGYRRHTYFTLGQLGLFLRCWSDQGRHDFAVGNCAAGPNAFVNCRAARALSWSGPVESWASGVLYDNVRIDGSDLRFENLWATPPGTGWAAANCLAWNCRAANVRVFRPPGADNWAVGAWASMAGDGLVESPSDFVPPLSLYQAQVAERLGEREAALVEPILGKPNGATNPTYAEAAQFLAEAAEPARELVDVIRDNMSRAAAARAKQASSVPPFDEVLARDASLLGSTVRPKETSDLQTVTTRNGWLAVDGGVLIGKRYSPPWWRGTMRAADAAREFGPSVTRFAPGRYGAGLTDDVQQISSDLAAAGFAAYDHHYGLWYDRRRDDHLMVRRADGDAAPPFYEQPFARSGQGTAWDGLSKYDLTKFNPWYWNRLRQFAAECDRRGTLLIQQHFFQHNILEAGAHWADCPWRPANNVNQLELPEPPPYTGDKRLFMAQHFYDPANTKLREFQRHYIRQCLDAFADRRNVVHSVSAEYSGPTEFVEFWLDVIAEWQREHERDVLVALSCPKNVQDAILADQQRRKLVDVIDIRYWCYDKDFNLYAPEGGKYLAPRQHMRQLQPKAGSFAAIVKAVAEYRVRYPDIAVTYFAGENCRSGEDGWGVLMGGGSIAAVELPKELAQALLEMSPTYDSAEGPWLLRNKQTQALAYAQKWPSAAELSGFKPDATYRVTWYDDGGEAASSAQNVTADAKGAIVVRPAGTACWLRQQ